MPNFIDRLLLKYIQRMPKNAWQRFLLRYGLGRYRKLYQHHDDRKELTQNYWGGEGGFEHALQTLHSTKESWMDTYGEFYNEAKKSLRPDIRILELGCSAGQWAQRLELDHFPCSYLGIDINAKSIAFATQNFSKAAHLQFQAIDIEDLNQLETFDCVFSCQTFFFLTQEQIRRILSKMKKGAVLVLSEPVSSELKQDDEALAGAVGFSHPYSSLLREAGFKVLYEGLKDMLQRKDQRRITLRAQKET